MDTDEVEVLAMKADALEAEIRLAAHDNAIAMHAATSIAAAAAGLRKAIVKEQARAERALVHAERIGADSEERKYDDLTKQLAKQRGISYAEMQEIRDQAAARARAAATGRSISEQVATAPSLNPGSES